MDECRRDVVVVGGAAGLGMRIAQVLFDGMDIPIVGEPIFRGRVDRMPFVPLGPVSVSGRITYVDPAVMKARFWKVERERIRRARQKAQRLARRAMRRAG